MARRADGPRRRRRLRRLRGGGALRTIRGEALRRIRGESGGGPSRAERRAVRRAGRPPTIERIPPRARPPIAWGVHVLTASGVVVGLLALLAVVAEQPRVALGWLIVALVIDGLDGPLARVLGVKEHAPRVDGMVLDLVVDYIPYVVVPALFVFQFGLLPAPLLVPGAAAILLTSLYCFARADMKAVDNYFVGFPATWNLVVFTLFLLGTPHWFNVVAIAVLGALTFTSVKFVHPVRVREWRWVTLPVTVGWLGAMVYLTAVHPAGPRWAQALVVVGLLYQGFLSARRTLRDFRCRRADRRAGLAPAADGPTGW